MIEENTILIRMHRILNTIDGKSARIAAEEGLTLPQFGVLEALDHLGDLSVGEVKEKILSSDGTIPVVVKNLEKEGLIEEKKDPKDKRRKILSLTGKGREKIESVYPKNEAMIEEEMGAWTKEEKRALIGLLCKYPRQEGGEDH